MLKKEILDILSKDINGGNVKMYPNSQKPKTFFGGKNAKMYPNSQKPKTFFGGVDDDNKKKRKELDDIFGKPKENPDKKVKQKKIKKKQKDNLESVSNKLEENKMLLNKDIKLPSGTLVNYYNDFKEKISDLTAREFDDDVDEDDYKALNNLMDNIIKRLSKEKAPAKKAPAKKAPAKKAPAKKEPAKDKKVVAQIKKEYKNALNEYYGEIFKIRKNDDFSQYPLLVERIETKTETDIFQIREKYKYMSQLIYQNIFRDNSNDFNLNLDELDYKKLSNYKKLIKYDTAFDYIGKPEKEKSPAKKSPAKKEPAKKKKRMVGTRG